MCPANHGGVAGAERPERALTMRTSSGMRSILRCMSHAHVANVLGALGLALADRLAEAAERAGGPSAADGARDAVRHASRGANRRPGKGCGLSHSGAVRLVDRLAGRGPGRAAARRRPAVSSAVSDPCRARRAARRVLADRQAAMHSLLSLLTDDQQAQLADLAESAAGRARRRRRPPRHGCAGCATSRRAVARAATAPSLGRGPAARRSEALNSWFNGRMC